LDEEAAGFTNIDKSVSLALFRTQDMASFFINTGINLQIVYHRAYCL